MNDVVLCRSQIIGLRCNVLYILNHLIHEQLNVGVETIHAILATLNLFTSRKKQKRRKEMYGRKEKKCY